MQSFRVPSLALLALSAACAVTEPADDVGAVSFAATATFPDLIPVPVNPEGIATGNGTAFFFGNLINGGAMYRGNLRNGRYELLRAADGRPTLGLKYDPRSGYLFAARGNTGWGTVVDGRTGATVADFSFATTGTFINDVVITRDAAYFTDSSKPQLYRVPLGSAGELIGGFTTIALGGDWVQVPAAHCGVGSGAPALPGLSGNGIVATADGGALLVNNLRVGTVSLVDPATGVASAIDLGGANVCFADGMVLAGNRLYVVQNLLGKIAVIDLAADHRSGVVAREIVAGIPITTVAMHGASVYAVTAGFTFLPSTQPKQVMRFDR